MPNYKNQYLRQQAGLKKERVALQRIKHLEKLATFLIDACYNAQDLPLTMGEIKELYKVKDTLHALVLSRENVKPTAVNQ